jgi:hypothetical protein
MGVLMIVIAFLCVVLALPFEWLTPQGQLYRKIANSHAVSAARKRASEREARWKGDIKGAERLREEAERIERQGWVYRKASFRYWKWPELKPGSGRPPGH